MSEIAKTKPFPALTPAQRLHIEIYGYVIVPDVLDQDEISTLKDTLYHIEDDFRRTGELPGPNCFNTSTSCIHASTKGPIITGCVYPSAHNETIQRPTCIIAFITSSWGIINPIDIFKTGRVSDYSACRTICCHKCSTSTIHCNNNRTSRPSMRMIHEQYCSRNRPVICCIVVTRQHSK